MGTSTRLGELDDERFVDFPQACRESVTRVLTTGISENVDSLEPGEIKWSGRYRIPVLFCELVFLFDHSLECTSRWDVDTLEAVEMPSLSGSLCEYMTSIPIWRQANGVIAQLVRSSSSTGQYDLAPLRMNLK